MKGNTFQRSLTICGALLAICLGLLIHSHLKLSEQRELAKREQKDVRKVQQVGQLVYNYLEEVRAQNKDIDSNQKGDLNMSQILRLCNKHDLKSPANAKENLSIKRTYQEKIISLKLREEPLKNVVLFLLDVEALGNIKVSKLDLTRNPKNPDVWNIDVSIVRRLKKEEKAS